MNDYTNLPSWNLSSLFANSQDCKKAVMIIKTSVEQFAKQYKGKITTAEILEKAVKSYEHIVDGMQRIGTYAYLNFITHMNEQDRKVLYQQVSESTAVFASEIAFFTIELNQLDEDGQDNN